MARWLYVGQSCTRVNFRELLWQYILKAGCSSHHQTISVKELKAQNTALHSRLVVVVVMTSLSGNCLYGGTKMSRRDEEFHQTMDPEGSVSPS